MALFFDSAWFDARLSALGFTRATLAPALGLDEAQLGEVWKDQRELSVRQVRTMAALLVVDAKEIARRAGVSTPVPSEDGPCEDGPHDDGPHDDGIEERLARLEADLAEIKSLLRSR